MALPYPTILVPGITASNLRDTYPLPPESVWTVFKKRFDRVALHPNDLRYEARQPSLVKADQIFEVAYEELVEEMRDELTDLASKEVPVFPFAYDWRHPLEVIQQQLADFIQQVIDRVKLMPHYHKTYGSELKVNLIGHSMGGLVISRCLSDQSQALPINKVSTLATPYQGSFEAIVKLTVGTGNLGSGKPSHAERRSARLTPALYQLLPAFKKGISIDSAFPQTLLDPKSWQPSVSKSIEKYIRNVGLPDSKPPELAAKLFKQLLKGAKDNSNKIKNLDLSRHGLTNKDWLAIVGVDTDTRVKQRVTSRRGVPVFEFDQKADVANLWDPDDTTKNWRQTGDGTVPYEGAVPPFLGEDELVLITPDDYGFWELSDKALSKVGGFHGILPNMDLLKRILIRFFTNTGDSKYDNTWGRAVPGIQNWNPPLSLRRKKD